ncbi:MAG TPA: TolC family protein [Candidatus Krumholzibacteria bacterium]|nr:TolC family protein [Candidatus Krumholzibacteria bacterium]
MNVRRAMAALTLIVCALATSARAEVYDLERSIDLALKTSTNVGISTEQLQTARSGVVRSYAEFMPNLSMSAWAGHSFAGPSTGVFVDAQGRPVQPSGFDYEAYTFGLQSQMRLFDWGANLNGLSQSKRNADAAAHNLEYTRDVIRAIVIREYYDLVRQRRLLEVQEADLEAKTRNLEQVEAFYKIGSRTKADFLQARVDKANSQLNLLNVKNAEAIAAARLKSRLNIPQEQPIEVDKSIEFTPGTYDATTEIDHMFQNRSDLLAGRQQIEAASAGVSVAKKGRYPTLDASFSYSWNDRAFPTDGAVFKRDYVWSVGVFFGWNIFDRFQSRAAIQQAKAEYRIAEYNLQQAKIDAVLDVKQIMLNLDQARERLDLAEETVAAAEENNRLAQERYRVGAGTILETIEASASLTQAQASLIDARVDYLINRADLQRATGRQITTTN